MPTVAIVDDHAVIREGLRAALAAEPDITVVGDAGDAASTYDTVDRCSPDVLILDVGLPGPGGLAIAREVLRRHPEEKILFLSMHSHAGMIVDALATGALGYIEKDQPVSQVATAIRSVARGNSYLSPGVSQMLVDEYVRARARPPVPATSPGVPAPPEGRAAAESALSGLTPREHDVFRLLVQAKCNKEIATDLGIRVRTVETHRLRLMRKVNVHSIAELMRFAYQHDLMAHRAADSSGRQGEQLVLIQ